MIGEYNIFNCFASINIGNNCVTADHVSFITNTHNYKDINTPIKCQGGEAHQISIGEGSWIGIKATILDGTSIGKNCVVAAHALVKGEFPDYCVIAGCPARVIYKYNMKKDIWEKI